MKQFFTSPLGIFIIIVVALVIIGYFAGWFKSPIMHGGGGGHGHGGRGWWGNFWYPYYTVVGCPTGNCTASDGTIGTWITNADRTCTCQSKVKTIVVA